MSNISQKFDIFGGYVYSVDMSALSSFGSGSGFNPSEPYNQLPPLPPPQELETRRVLRAVGDAREALAELNMACKLIPNPEVINSTIPLREARASSEIENIVTTNDELFRAAWKIDPIPSASTKEALSYNRALHAGIELLDRGGVSIRTAKEVCSILQGYEVDVRSTPGTFIGDPVTNKIYYTPPSGREVIDAHLDLWEKFIYSDHALDPLVLMAVTHYQFEAIHPFNDGNGRTGRILNILLLIQEQRLHLPVLYLSGYIVRKKNEYYSLLRAVTSEHHWEEWILFMVDGVRESAKEAVALIEELREAQAHCEERIREAGIAPAKELAELLFVDPYLRISNVVDSGLVRRQQASTWLHILADRGVIGVQQVGRQKIFINHMALEILTRL